jgi:hypothetical protein
MDRLHAEADNQVEACRRHGRPWELAFALQVRCKLRNDQPDKRQSALADGAESLALFTGLGDRWGMAEALAGQSEAAGFAGDYVTAARCAREAITLARTVGADQGVPILQVRLGDALLGSGELEEGERWLLLGVEASYSHGPYGQGAGFFGSVVLAALRAEQGRTADARAILEPLLPQYSEGSTVSLLGGMVESFLGWLDAMDGRPGEGWTRLRAGVGSITDHPMAGFVGDSIGLVMIPTAAYILLACARAGTEAVDRPALRAARLLGAHDTMLPVAGVHHLARRALAETVAGLREDLGDEAYDAAYAEGGALGVGDAVALLLQD